MPIKAKLITKGFEDYLERLARAEKDLNAAVAEALQAGGDILLSGMLNRVPRDTNNLADHLGIEGPFRDGNSHFIRVGVLRTADKKTALYANYQEYGTPRMAAHPYITPTIKNDMGKARKRMAEVFEEWLK